MRIVALSLFFAALALLGGGVGGCARYEYDIVQPPDLARHIANKVDTTVDVEPLQYALRTVDNRLVMRVYNRTDEPMELIGPRSSVVDPSGQSHPLRSQPLAGQSFIKLIFPPPRPRVYDPGPTFGVGVGYGIGSAHPHRRHHPHYHSGGYFYDGDEPRYFAVYDEGDVYYWDWRGAGEARVSLVFRRGDKEFKHEFTFRRVKI
jgi:hypothetical protein